jgi:hypothetical protein
MHRLSDIQFGMTVFGSLKEKSNKNSEKQIFGKDGMEEG